MASAWIRRLRYRWPLIGVVMTFLIGLAIGGIGVGVLTGMLSIPGFGLGYLIQNGTRRRRGTLAAPSTQTPEEKAQSDARFLRIAAIFQVVMALVGVVVVAVGRGSYLPGKGFTAWLLLIAALGITGAPHTWAVAERRASQRSLRWAWALSGVLGLALGLASLAIAVTNQRSHWIGGTAWTLVFAMISALWLLGAPGDLARARHSPSPGS
jgi:multisubunit Na+/H+ antiporter MnhB subunit